MSGANDRRSAAHKRAAAQEKYLARRGDGKLTPGSGNKLHKGDVIRYNGLYRVEAKCTTHRSFSVTLAMLEKIENAALANRELPAIVIEFLDSAGNPFKEIAVVPVYALDADNLRKP
jgi:hypothetical protein